MQSTLDRKVIYLMLRSARRQEAERRSAPMPCATPCAVPQSLAEDGWWLTEPPPARSERAPLARKTKTFAPREISDE